MRPKRIKGVNETLLSTHGVITEIDSLILPQNELELEIGSGKGDFITTLANDNKDKHFIAIERNKYVCYRLLEKKEMLALENITIILGDAADIKTYLNGRVVNKIYLNFSDPWPKKRHHKRRLTAVSFLSLYLDILAEKGTLQFRTDHEAFFNDSIETITQHFDIFNINRDLPESAYMTEYEVKKRKLGPIFQLKGRK